MTKKVVSNDDIMATLSKFADSVDRRFDAMDERFESIDQRFESIDQRFESIDKHLFTIDNRLGNLETDMTDVKTKVSHIYNVLDAHMQRIESILQENAVQDYQQKRMERWIFQLADKLDVKLKYE